jgi:hypothetical protein
MSSRFLKRLLGLSLIVALIGPAFAQEAEVESKPAAVAGESKLDDLRKRLDADEFETRQQASKELEELGEKAIPALEKWTASESGEVSMRSFDILRGHFEKGTGSVKEAAKQALERIAKADLGPASKRAAEILNPHASNAATPARPGLARILPAPAGGIRVGGARVVVAGAAAGGGIETKIRIEDGVKTTEVRDKDRQVKIVDDPDKGLTLEVTETKDGKETTQKYEAKNADDLKAKHPEAHKIYEQYSAKGAEFKIGGFEIAPGIAPALPLMPRILPAPAPAIPIEPAVPAPEMPAKNLEAFKQLEKAIQEMEANLKQAAEESGKNEALKKAQDRLDEVRRELEKLRSSLK